MEGSSSILAIPPILLLFQPGSFFLRLVWRALSFSHIKARKNGSEMGIKWDPKTHFFHFRRGGRGGTKRETIPPCNIYIFFSCRAVCAIRIPPSLPPPPSPPPQLDLILNKPGRGGKKKRLYLLPSLFYGNLKEQFISHITSSRHLPPPPPLEIWFLQYLSHGF